MWTLMLSIGGLLLSALVGAVSRAAGGVLVSAALLAQLIAVPIAIRFLMRGGHATPANILMTVFAGLPWVLLILGVISIFFGLTRFHI
jgi:hypothetical protein